MKLSCCLLACDSNALYLDFWPVVRRAWKEIVAIDCKLVFIGHSLPPHLEGDPDVILFPPIPDIKTAFQAQTIRLLFPALLPYEGAIIISDIDLIPMNARFFHDNIRNVPEDRFLLYRPPMEEYLEVPIMFNAATPKMWAKFFNIGGYEDEKKTIWKATVSEVRERLVVWAKECTPQGYTGVPGKDNWCFDQRTLYKVIKANIADVTILQDAQTGWSRLDRYNLERQSLTADQRQRIEYNLYTDYHMLRPLSQYRAQNEEVFDLLFKSAKRVQRTNTDLRSFTFREEDIITRDRYLELVNKELKEHVSYVKMDYFHNQPMVGTFRWRGQEHPQLPLKDIIVSGHSDYALDEKMYASYKDKVKLWFSTNVDLVQKKDSESAKSVISLPIGLTCYLDDPVLGDHKLLLQVPRDGRRDALLYLNINVATYPVERQVVYDRFKDEKYVMIGKHDNSKEGRLSFLQDIAKSKFVLCPRGNGIDTHRLWECLYLGAIPIVRYEVGYSAFTDLPILFVQSWAEVTEDFLTKQYRSMHAKQWNMHKLKVSYWLNLIKYKVRQLYPMKSAIDSDHSLASSSYTDVKRSTVEEKIGVDIDHIYIIDKDIRQTRHLCSQMGTNYKYTVIEDVQSSLHRNDIGEANRRVQVVNPSARRDKGCSESEIKTASKHIEAWRAAQKQGYNNILVLESSAILCQHFFARLLPLYTQRLSQSSDIALLHAGCEQHVDRFGITTNPGQFWYPIPQPHMRTCCSYLLSKEARDKLLSTTIPFCLPIDWEMNYQNTMHGLKVYWAEPPIIKEREGAGDDLEGKLLDRIAHLRWSNKFNEAYDLLRQVPPAERHFRYLDEMSIVCSYLPKEKKEGEGALQTLVHNFTKYEGDIRTNQGRILSNMGVYGRSDLASELNALLGTSKLNASKEKVGDPGMDDATREPFNIDNVVAQEVRRLIKHFNIKRVVETGTYKGVTTEFFAKEVLRVDTIEIVEENAKAARERLKEYKHVTVWQGSSIDIMPRVLAGGEDDKSMILFYLDSHWRTEWPILDELKYINEYCKDRAIIVIDDFQVPGRSFAYDKYDGIHNNWAFIQKEVESCYTIKPFYYYNERSTRPAFTIGKIYIVPSGSIPLSWAKEEHGNYYSTI